MPLTYKTKLFRTCILTSPDQFTETYTISYSHSMETISIRKLQKAQALINAKHKIQHQIFNKIIKVNLIGGGKQIQ
jgi:hypothetical protein